MRTRRSKKNGIHSSYFHQSDDAAGQTRKILDFGVRKLDIPDPHFYFQAPGGQVTRLVGIDEDLSFYEGAGAGPDVAKVKEALKKEAMTVSYGISHQVGIKSSPEVSTRR